ncbi:M48 family metalloprotease [Asticcacaulis sp. ZE23SCel15]|uniref:M48 family metalloprotease n=1 Tax=Asticcacaulis sp. ZE23SCel15 TaxID=3059027 RepID=UPI00265E09B2|nr:M48 family metalloprotease [Asticcacaulis sp. ZE23SCel15]WKL56405.1 M48 family metalloprotease [Asticcacaulis sp. ZE23SCel15]
MTPQAFKGIGKVAIAAVALLAVCVPGLGQAQAVIRDTEIEAFLKKESRTVLEASYLDPDRVQFLIVASNDLNAFATSRQRIGLNTGLIMEAETPNQLLGVIAHEAGHQSAGHTVRSDEIYQAAKTPMAISLGLGIISILAGAPDAGVALLGSSSTFGTLGALRYMQTQESAADLAGIAALERAGMSGEGMVEFFDKFRQSETFSNAERYKYFRSHPLSRERIQTLRALVSKQSHYNAKDSQATIDEFAIVRAKLSGFLDPAQFVFQKYPETDTSYPARYARVIAYYKQTEVQKALTELDKLITEQPNNPYLWELKGQIYFETGQAELSKPAHLKSVELMPGAPLLHLNLGQTLIATGTKDDAEEAIRQLKLSLQAEDDNSFAWRLLAQAYDGLGRAGEARLASAEAEFFNGNFRQARTFAVWSQKNLDKNSPEFRRARDIVITTSAAMGIDPVEEVTKTKK